MFVTTHMATSIPLKVSQQLTRDPMEFLGRYRIRFNNMVGRSSPYGSRRYLARQTQLESACRLGLSKKEIDMQMDQNLPPAPSDDPVEHPEIPSTPVDPTSPEPAPDPPRPPDDPDPYPVRDPILEPGDVPIQDPPAEPVDVPKVY